MPDQLLFVVITGPILGLEHALEPDHLVAVSVFANERKDLCSAANTVRWQRAMTGVAGSVSVAPGLVIAFRVLFAR